VGVLIPHMEAPKVCYDYCLHVWEIN
jgi:hypothetical protein